MLYNTTCIKCQYKLSCFASFKPKNKSLRPSDVDIKCLHPGSPIELQAKTQGGRLEAGGVVQTLMGKTVSAGFYLGWSS